MINLYLDIVVLIGLLILFIGILLFIFKRDTASGSYSIEFWKFGIKSTKSSAVLTGIGLLLLLIPAFQYQSSNYKMLASFYNPLSTEEVKQLVVSGVEQYKNANMIDAAKYFKEAADIGDPQAQWHYGEMLYHGEGISKDSAGGMEWLKKSADNGYSIAKSLVAIQLFQDAVKIGNEKVSVLSYEKLEVSRKMLVETAATGEVNGEYCLGRLQYYVDKNESDGLKWVSKAANGGLPSAQDEYVNMRLASYGRAFKAGSQKISTELFDDLMAMSARACNQGSPTTAYIILATMIDTQPEIFTIGVKVRFYVILKELIKDNPTSVEYEDNLIKLTARMSKEELETARTVHKTWKPIYEIKYMHNHFFN